MHIVHTQALLFFLVLNMNEPLFGYSFNELLHSELISRFSFASIVSALGLNMVQCYIHGSLLAVGQPVKLSDRSIYVIQPSFYLFPKHRISLHTSRYLSLPIKLYVTLQGFVCTFTFLKTALLFYNPLMFSKSYGKEFCPTPLLEKQFRQIYYFILRNKHSKYVRYL